MAKKTYIGEVVSDKMQKTVVVAVRRSQRHPVYKKLLRRTRKFKADNELGAQLGDQVKIVESRPISKEKRWRVVGVIERKS
ncbi:30S ribosomal protein S17 [Candidatus Parcubacteria bacterium]|nr:30S ribosomal protein S17 [Candidatus Parcubacteria bacterium]